MSVNPLKLSRNSVIWLLLDHRMGNVNQCLGVANALDLPYIEKRVVYNRLAKLPNILLGKTSRTIQQDISDSITPPWPDIAITAGRRCTPLLRYIKQQSGNKTKIVQLMWPGKAYDDIDLLVLPKHDQHLTNDQIMVTLGSPHKLTHALLEREQRYWHASFGILPDYKIALIVGGDAGHCIFRPEHAQALMDKTIQLAKIRNAGVMITTSPRTSPEAEAVIRRSLDRLPHYFHSWREQKQQENPYIAMVASADEIIVTGDSMSMCSECCFAGKPVWINAPADITQPKHALLHHDLYDHGYARPLADLDQEDEEAFSLWGAIPEPLNESDRVAKRILQLWD